MHKILVANIAHRDTQVDWAAVPAADLKNLGPAFGDFVNELHSTWSVADVGRLFFHRADWGIFLGLFACLWHQPAQQHCEGADELLELVGSPAFCQRAAAMARASGHGMGPATVLESFLSS